jgi:hypothetical protein
MDRSERHPVFVRVVAARPIAAVRAWLPIARVSSSFADYLNQVYAAGRDGAVLLDGQNIFVYRGGSATGDDVDVEFGVGVKAPFSSVGGVSYSETPAGEVATTTHWGDYAKLGEAHAAVIAWCAAHDRERAGPRWEVYGHWVDDPSQLRTDVFYLLR